MSDAPSARLGRLAAIENKVAGTSDGGNAASGVAFAPNAGHDASGHGRDAGWEKVAARSDGQTAPHSMDIGALSKILKRAQDERAGLPMAPGSLAICTVISALFGLFSTMLVTLLGQTRIFLSMARDGLLPSLFGRVHSRFRTPHLSTMFTGTIIAVVAG